MRIYLTWAQNDGRNEWNRGKNRKRNLILVRGRKGIIHTQASDRTGQRSIQTYSRHYGCTHPLGREVDEDWACQREEDKEFNAKLLLAIEFITLVFFTLSNKIVSWVMGGWTYCLQSFYWRNMFHGRWLMSLIQVKKMCTSTRPSTLTTTTNEIEHLLASFIINPGFKSKLIKRVSRNFSRTF